MDNKRALKLFVVLCRTFHDVSEIAKKDIKRYGLSLTEFEALELLYHKGPQAIQDIGKKVLLTSGSMTYVINQLEKKGFVKRVICENDRRIIYTEITENGSRLLDDIFPQHEECIANVFSSLSETEIESLILTLKKIKKTQD